MTLLDHGCRRAQGFLLSRPLTADATESLLAEGRVPVRFGGHAKPSASPR
jgi:EAL domain-containing protein (putative c-di-GMP-specific phosphodiesterase class I)